MLTLYRITKFLVQYLKLLNSFHSTLFPYLLRTSVRIELVLGKRTVISNNNSGAATHKINIIFLTEKATVL